MTRKWANRQKDGVAGRQVGRGGRQASRWGWHAGKQVGVAGRQACFILVCLHMGFQALVCMHTGHWSGTFGCLCVLCPGPIFWAPRVHLLRALTLGAPRVQRSLNYS